jgi:hypothetical protein
MMRVMNQSEIAGRRCGKNVVPLSAIATAGLMREQQGDGSVLFNISRNLGVVQHNRSCYDNYCRAVRVGSSIAKLTCY